VNVNLEKLREKHLLRQKNSVS
jgi:hypothetical protein